uniref:Uncharacterized protein n=1 Tax=Rangifer tarandus platyrhynchus TaxID=3082113 RepID=A0ACB0E5B6_RANTA|nr:unnamed protein product [Rangifer tarandus platyrhynchus]
MAPGHRPACCARLVLAGGRAALLPASPVHSQRRSEALFVSSLRAERPHFAVNTCQGGFLPAGTAPGARAQLVGQLGSKDTAATKLPKQQPEHTSYLVALSHSENMQVSVETSGVSRWGRLLTARLAGLQRAQRQEPPLAPHSPGPHGRRHSQLVLGFAREGSDGPGEQTQEEPRDC